MNQTCLIKVNGKLTELVLPH